MKKIYKIACITPEIILANSRNNIENIIEIIKELEDKHTDIAVISQDAFVGYSIGDIKNNSDIRDRNIKSIDKLRLATKDMNVLVAICATIDQNLVKILIRNQKIIHVEAENDISFVSLGEVYRNSHNNIYLDNNKLAFIGDELSYKNLGKILNNIDDANIVIHFNSVNYDVDSRDLKNVVKTVAKAKNIIYIVNGLSYGESTTDYVYSSDKFVYEDEREVRYSNTFDYKEVICATVNPSIVKRKYTYEGIVIHTNEDIENSEYKLPANPFLEDIDLEEVIKIQAEALARRLKAINIDKVTIGVSGGLDSTLALIVSHECMKLLKLDSSNIYGITMPGFGTSSRTKGNADLLMKLLGVTSKVCDIREVTEKHLRLIGHDMLNKDIAYENAQARERTQILMDMSNMIGAIVVGTGDLSEAALGFATFNGDHISNYNVNASIPKTLMREVIRDYAIKNPKLHDVLIDIIDTPISPELIPSNKDFSQKTEDIVGPYELHDLFIYYYVYKNLSRDEIRTVVKASVGDKFSDDEINKWLNIFFKRFISNQFKRSCSVDAPKITRVSLSPREGYVFASDLNYKEFIDENL